jgi:pyridinium-3,5-biscarboxylic acid mononucleotide sulfurtransferase
MTDTLRNLDEIRRASAEKLEALKRAIGATGGALVAFSAGVDSTFLLAVACQVLGERALAVTALSASIPQAEREEARVLARRLGAKHLEVASHEVEDPRYAANPVDRCYYCKSELFALCRQVAESRGISAIFDGFNADDRRDHRPGHRAAAELKVRSPLAEAGLGKIEIRAWSEAYGLPTWDKPQMACLASRLPYGTAVTPERLAQIEAAEAGVRAAGIHLFRVRFHGDIGRIEVAAEEMDVAFARRTALVEAVKASGFKMAVLDLEPFRSGRMNEIADVRLPVVP